MANELHRVADWMDEADIVALLRLLHRLPGK